MIEIPKQLKGPNGFPNFIHLAWTQALNLPQPTPVQYDIARWLANGPDRQVTMAFRGVGKSFLASALVVYSLLLDPSLNIMVVSASRDRADDFSGFCFMMMHRLGALTAGMLPSEDQRSSKIKFDVREAPPGHAPSVFSLGINSQLSGQRADIIIADDVSTSANSVSQVMREKIHTATREFTSILKPGGGRIIYLGTPHTEQDLLHGLPERGFTTRIWPAEVPPKALQIKQGSNLAPMIREQIQDGATVGTPTDPQRFDEDELELKKLEGRSYYAMQFLLDHSLSDQDRYCLKINHLIVDDLDKERCYQHYVYAQDPDLRWTDLHNVGFNGDYFHRPFKREGEMVKYQVIVMSIDPSGKGRDETSYSVVAHQAGTLFVLDNGGEVGGFEEPVLRKLAQVAKKYKVNAILVESNFGMGMFSNLLKPILISEGWPCSIEEVRQHRNKMVRICDTLEPLVGNRKLVFDKGVIERDWSSTQHYPPDKRVSYTLMHQFSRATRKPMLRHDDRLDSLAMACHYWVESVAIDAQRSLAKFRKRQVDKQLKEYLKVAPGQLIIGGGKSKGTSWIRTR